MDILYYCKHRMTLKWRRDLTVVPQQASVIQVYSGVTNISIIHIHKEVVNEKPPNVKNL